MKITKINGHFYANDFKRTCNAKQYIGFCVDRTKKNSVANVIKFYFQF